MSERQLQPGHVYRLTLTRTLVFVEAQTELTTYVVALPDQPSDTTEWGQKVHTPGSLKAVRVSRSSTGELIDLEALTDNNRQFVAELPHLRERFGLEHVVPGSAAPVGRVLAIDAGQENAGALVYAARRDDDGPWAVVYLPDQSVALSQGLVAGKLSPSVLPGDARLVAVDAATLTPGNRQFISQLATLNDHMEAAMAKTKSKAKKTTTSKAEKPVKAPKAPKAAKPASDKKPRNAAQTVKLTGDGSCVPKRGQAVVAALKALGGAATIEQLAEAAPKQNGWTSKTEPLAVVRWAVKELVKGGQASLGQVTTA